MSDNICPRCKNEINEGDKFCKSCGLSLDNQKTNINEIKSNFINFTDDITSKIQNKLENEDILKANEIKDMIKNLDEDSFNRLLDKHGISPSRLKTLDFNRLLDKVGINKVKEDLMEFGVINPKSDPDVETVKTEVIIEDEGENDDFQKNKVPVVEAEEVKEEPQNNNAPEHTKEPKSSNINVCSKCGFENRSKVKFCTNCGNKLV